MFTSEMSALLRRFLGLALLLATASAHSQPRLTIRTPTNAVELTFQGSRGTTNRVEWIGTLGLTNWTPLTNVVLTSNQLVSVVHLVVTNLSERFYRLAITGGPQTNSPPTVLLDNLTGTDADGLNIDFDQHIAVGFNLVNSHAGSWTFRLGLQTGGNLSASSLQLQLLTNHFNATTGQNEPGASTVLSLSGGSLSSGIYTVSANGTLNAAKYWLVARSSSFQDFYTWINHGQYSETGASLLGVRSDLGDGAGWQAVATSGATGHPLSLRINVTQAP